MFHLSPRPSDRQDSDPIVTIPLPAAWNLVKTAGQLTLQLDKEAAKRHRLVYGCVAFMTPSESKDTAAPFRAQVVLKLTRNMCFLANKHILEFSVQMW